MRALRPGSLPSDTAVRFLLLLAAVTSASLYMFQSLWFTLRGELFREVLLRCAEGAADLSSGGPIGTTTAQLQADAECRSGILRDQAMFAVAGAAAVLVLAWVAYRLLPAARIRRRHLEPPDPEDGAALLGRVTELSAGAGVDPAPAVVMEVTNPAVTGYAFGAGRDFRLGVTGGLVVAQALDPPAFAAVVRHELGHMANRDVAWTYYATAVWWSFVGVAVLPVVVTLAFRDVDYLIRLGWRTAILAGLVGLTVTALLRSRELYADDRAVQWGSTVALDRLLAAQPATRTRRPATLRTHPTATVRRSLIADPDGMFSASGWAAFAAGIAAGTAMASYGDLLYEVTSRWAVALAALVVAPLVAVVLCASAWQVALREAVRGIEVPVVARLGLGMGAGLALAPMLTINAAVGGVATGLEGWAGYGLWGLWMVLMGGLVTRWVVDVARLRVAVALAQPGAPRRALAGHVVVLSLVIALWLAYAAYARLFLTVMGPEALGFLALWRLLPGEALGSGLGLVPLAVCALLAVLPIRARLLAGSWRPAGSWFWRDPTGGGDAGIGVPEVVSTAPRWSLPVVIGLAAGVAAGLAPLGVLLVGLLLDPVVRESETFSVAIGESVGTAHLVAAVCAAGACAAVAPRRWWPMALPAALLACSAVAVLTWLTLAAHRFGLLASGEMPRRIPGWELTYFMSLHPAAMAVGPAFLVAAAIGSARTLRTGSGAPVPARDGDRWIVRAALGALGAFVVAGLLMTPAVLRTAGLAIPRVATATFEVAVPPDWQGAVDRATGSAQFVTVAQDLQVEILPIPQARPADGGGAVEVGGRLAGRVLVQDDGAVRFVVYDVLAPSGPHRVIVVGTARAIEARTEELGRLLAGVRWSEGSAGEGRPLGAGRLVRHGT